MIKTIISIVAGFAALSAISVSAGKSPNVIFILTDDMGWNALSLPADPEMPESGSSYYQTPHTDRLAKSGIRFSRAYSPSSVCDPTRTSIQYGMTPTALGKFATVAPKTLPPTSDAMVSRLKAEKKGSGVNH